MIRKHLFLFLLVLLVLLAGSSCALGGALDEWIDLEQTRINRSVDTNKIVAPDVENQKHTYRPEARRWFPLRSIWVPEQNLDVALDPQDFDSELRALFIRTHEGRTEYRLLIHPESEKFYRTLLDQFPSDGTKFQATSTASSRTLRVRVQPTAAAPNTEATVPIPEFFAKVSLDVELGGGRRTIPRGEVARSVGTSRYLRELETRMGDGVFTHMPEPFGISPKGWDRGGMIIRKIPHGIQTGETRLVPLFSLYAQDENGRTLLQDFAEKSGLSPQEFVEKHLLAPFYDGWVRWNLEGAVTMEAHSQNVLLELNPEGKPTGRFVHRDLGGFNIDMKARQFPTGLELPTFTNLANDYHQSFVKTAREQSLATYFNGGFLYNIDRELQRIQPGYRAGEIFKQAKKKLAETLSAQSGEKNIRPQRLSRGSGIQRQLQLAQKAYDRNHGFKALSVKPNWVNCIFNALYRQLRIR